MFVNLPLLTISCVAMGPPCTWPTCFPSRSVLTMRLYFSISVKMKSQLKPINSPIYIVMETRKAILVPQKPVKWYAWVRAKAVNKSSPQENVARLQWRPCGTWRQLLSVLSITWGDQSLNVTAPLSDNGNNSSYGHGDPKIVCMTR